MARREERAYREYVSDEQRSQPRGPRRGSRVGVEEGCPARELCDESLLRDTRVSASNRGMDTFLQDLRYAARTLIKNPGFAALTIVCLALGIGVNSTIFSVVDTVAIRPLPFRDPERLISLRTTHQANGVDRGGASFL